jgi:hypothetical protein
MSGNCRRSKTIDVAHYFLIGLAICSFPCQAEVQLQTLARLGSFQDASEPVIQLRPTLWFLRFEASRPMPIQFADSELESIARSYRLETLHGSDDTIYVLRPDLTLVYVNDGWTKFAAENGGEPMISERWPIGCAIAESIPDVLRPFYTDHFSKCLESRSPWQHRYECSSPDVYREFLMTTYPLGDRQGLLVVNSLDKSSPHNRLRHPPIEEWYRDENGMVVQCSHCRRIRCPAATAAWDWVPEWLNEYPERMSHGLCEPCYGYFYPGGLPRKEGYPKFTRTGPEHHPNPPRH